MLDSTFTSLYADTGSAMASVTSAEFLICCAASVVFGLVVAGVYMFRHSYSKNFVVTLALLPLIVQMVITLVNGNLGAGIAVMGVFNLVRFRSIPGTAKDIASVFLAMAVGLATGMGFIGLAALFTAVVALVNIAFVASPLGRPQEQEMELSILVPEDLEFNGMFDGVLAEHTSSAQLKSVQTTNMGSLYKLSYAVRVCDMARSKEMLDELRTLNGNLKVSLGYTEAREGL
ncbi:MAG: DUF4956 domain-containing protein [Coriobacteriales bacterium]